MSRLHEMQDELYEFVKDDEQRTAYWLHCEIVKIQADLLEAVGALLSNEEHAYSGGMRSYQKGSPTWQLWEDLRKAAKAAGSTA